MFIFIRQHQCDQVSCEFMVNWMFDTCSIQMIGKKHKHKYQFISYGNGEGNGTRALICCKCITWFLYINKITVIHCMLHLYNTCINLLCEFWKWRKNYKIKVTAYADHMIYTVYLKEEKTFLYTEDYS